MSEHTYYHPSVGVWVAIDDVPREILDTYPKGTEEISPSPGSGYEVDPKTMRWFKPAATLDELRAGKLAAIIKKADALLSAGAPLSGGFHAALDDGSRADLTAMATTATAASTNAIPWPESYSRGWITIENVRIPLATPADGLMLASSTGNYYAAIVQRRRDLKDAALAAADAAKLEEIDVEAGWSA